MGIDARRRTSSKIKRRYALGPNLEGLEANLFAERPQQKGKVRKCQHHQSLTLGFYPKGAPISLQPRSGG